MARVKAREIAEKLHGKVPIELEYIMSSMAERQEVQHQQIMELATLCNKLMDQFNQFLINAGVERQKLQKFMKSRGFAKDMTVEVGSISEADDDTGSTH